MTKSKEKNTTQRSDRVTMVDIARMAGVDVSTVSRALADSPRVIPETKAKIREIVRNTKYVTNFHAARLRTNRTGQVLVIVPNIAAAFFPGVISGIEDTLVEQGIGVLVGSTHRNEEREEAFARQLISGAIDGLIVMTGKLPPALQQFPDYERRVLAVSRPTMDPTIPTVAIDNAVATREAMEHLMSLGHKRIAHLAGPDYSMAFRTRTDTYLSVMRETGFKEYVCLVRLTKWDIQGGLTAVEKMLAKGPRPTAILAASDELAIGAIRAIRNAGLRVPQDISVMGYDDLPICEVFEPPITTIRLSRWEMGQVGARLLLENLDHSKSKPESRIIEHQLIVRESTDIVHQNI